MMQRQQHALPLVGRPVSRRQFLGMMAAVAGSVILAACGGTATTTPVSATATVPATTTTVASAPVTSTTTTAAQAAPAASSATSTALSVATVAPTTAAAATTTPPASSTTTGAATVRKVNANTASQAELLQAFQAAGITNADRWVREVMEYRPYPTNDPTFAKLRGELAKYNPGPGVVDQIIAVLSL